jgi:peptidoglycan/LPS O-acetylase OafA/YrhL
MWLTDIDHPAQIPFPDRPTFVAVKTVHDALKPTPLFRAGVWLLICMAVCALAWRKRDTPDGAYAIGVAGSAAVYVLTYFAVGVASDFRYAYWAVLAGLTGAVVTASSSATRQPAETVPS